MARPSLPAVICRDCALYHTARVLGLESPDCSQLDAMVIRNRPVARGEALYAAGDPVRYLYLVHSGACILHDGRDPQQVTGFFLPGEIVGFEDLDAEIHGFSAHALQAGSLCLLDLTGLDQLPAERLVGVQRYLLKAAAAHARLLQRERLITGLPSAEQRIAAFLLGLAERFQAHGLPSSSFRLPMSREEIASYLGLAPETVIRTLKKLAGRGLVSVRARQIQIHDPSALERLLAA